MHTQCGFGNGQILAVLSFSELKSSSLCQDNGAFWNVCKETFSVREIYNLITEIYNHFLDLKVQSSPLVEFHYHTGLWDN